ncbi:MAG: transcription antitermination factor NusB [Acidimicrobiia bacterium]|jgi:transcription antitermination factor NusB
MSEDDLALTIPARTTVEGLAEAIGRDVEEVRGVLVSHGHGSAHEETLDADLAVEVAGELGVEARIEPRDLALEHLYEYETRGEMGPKVGGKAGAMIDGVVSNVDDLDAMIESVSERWSVARMPIVDRNIIRIGLHELRNEPTTPTPVIINEAVRLAQTYSTEKSPSFVNGVLGTLAKTIRES